MSSMQYPGRTVWGLVATALDYGRINAAGKFEGEGKHAFGASFVGTTTNGYQDNTGYGLKEAESGAYDRGERLGGQ